MTFPQDPLDAELSSLPHLDAPAFTERVLLALPAHRRPKRPFILGAGALLASGVGAALIAGQGGSIGPSIVATLAGAPAPAFGALLATFLLVVTGCLVAAAEL